jgi:hypothetical protein
MVVYIHSISFMVALVALVTLSIFVSPTQDSLASQRQK